MYKRQPYWGYLSDVNKGKYVNVFDFGSRDISTENKNDMGELKALVLARGDHIANYTDIEGLDQDTYNDTTGMSVMLRAEAQLDQMIHGIVTALNDVLCPNVTAEDTIKNLTNGAATVSYTHLNHSCGAICSLAAIRSRSGMCLPSAGLNCATAQRRSRSTGSRYRSRARNTIF